MPENKTYEAFLVSDIFPEIERGKRLKKADQTEGKIPYASSTALNNGIDGFICKEKGSRVFFDCISLANSGSVGSAFYEPFEFVASDHITHLKKEGLKPNHYLYSASSLKNQAGNFNFNREINDARIKKMHIMLPTDDKGNPDWNYISFVIENKRNILMSRYIEFVSKRISSIEFKTVKRLDEIQWKTFRIGELFSIKRPAARNKDDYSEGNVPFVASGAINNGVMKCCKPNDDEKLDRGGCITVSPVDGSTFYQPMDFLGRGGAGSSILILYNEDIDLFSGQFVAKMISQTCSKYTYGHMGSKDSIKREFVQLPVNSNEEPDYIYMSQYIKNLMYKKYNQYIDHKKIKIRN